MKTELVESSVETESEGSETGLQKHTRDISGDRYNIMSLKNNVASLCHVTISCEIPNEVEVVAIDIDPMDFNFAEFDSWARQRFAFLSKDKIRYTNERRTEIIPAKRHFESESATIYIEKISNNVAKVNPASNSSPSPTGIAASDVMVSLIIAAFLACLYSDQYFPNIFPVSIFCANIEVYLDELPAFRGRGLFHRKGIIFESFVAFVCWSVTYLFIRRFLNPETSKVAFAKFSNDAFFGGMAAAIAVIMKSYLIANAQYIRNLGD
jgi:hypothetical protein